jgi:hypothetical protein
MMLNRKDEEAERQVELNKYTRGEARKALVESASPINNQSKSWKRL